MVHLFSFAVVAIAFIYAIESSTVKSPTAVAGGSNAAKACPPVNCKGKTKTCPYGYQKTPAGCDICKCNDPCNPQGKAKLCGANQRCHVEKKADGTFGTRCDAAPAKKGGKAGKTGKDAKDAKDGKDGKDAKADCTSPQVTGLCRAAHPRFHYNSATKACEQFTYGGCGGNANNYKTKADCEKACKV